MHQLLVIGPEPWSEPLERFVRYKNDTGMPAATITLETIEKTYGGVDQPERIKRGIEDHHRRHGAHYVLLAGDVDWFPTRYIRAEGTEWGTKWYPSDLYYADLYAADGSFDRWDADKDGIWGELDFQHTADHSKFNIDRINVYPDVAVGRIPASSQAELETYLDKVMSYEFAARESAAFGYPSRWFARAVFIVDGGDKAFGDPSQSEPQAAPLADAGFEILRRYQDSPPWDDAEPHERGAEVNAILNEGVGILHYNGHGTTSSLHGWYGTTDMGALTNDLMLPVVIAQGCYTARFHFDRDSYARAIGGDWTGASTATPVRPEPAHLQPARHDRDSLAEEFLVKRSTGAIAYIGAVSVHEQGGKALGRYLAEGIKSMPKPLVLGALWRNALWEYTDNELGGGVIGMGPYYAFIHVHKVMLFGDPSLRFGGLPTPWMTPGDGELPVELLVAAADV